MMTLLQSVCLYAYFATRSQRTRGTVPTCNIDVPKLGCNNGLKLAVATWTTIFLVHCIKAHSSPGMTVQRLCSLQSGCKFVKFLITSRALQPVFRHATALVQPASNVTS